MDQAGIQTWAGHGGGSFKGDMAYRFIYSLLVNRVLMKREFTTRGGDTITAGSNYVVARLDELTRIQQINFALTCHSSPLCQHEISIFKTTSNEIARESVSLSPDRVPLQSDHLRHHLVDRLETYGDLIPTERGTERQNQELLKVYNSVKNIASLDKQVEKLRALLQMRKDAKSVPLQYQKGQNEDKSEEEEEKKED